MLNLVTFRIAVWFTANRDRTKLNRLPNWPARNFELGKLMVTKSRCLVTAQLTRDFGKRVQHVHFAYARWGCTQLRETRPEEAR